MLLGIEMKALVLLFSLIGLSVQQYWYAGSTSTSFYTALSASVFNGACITSGYYSYYQTFTFSVPTSNFYYISAMFEKQWKNYARIELHNGTYSSTNPCGTAIFTVDGSSAVPHAQGLQYLTPGTYRIVVISTSSYSGIYAVHVDAANYTSASVARGPFWYSPYKTQSPGCSSTSYWVPYTYVTFTQPTTGSFDILYYAYAPTSSSSFYFTAALYTGVPTFLGTNATNACEGNFLNARGSDVSDIPLNINSVNYQAGSLGNVTLTAGNTYTVVMSVDDYSQMTATFGLWTRGTVMRQLGSGLSYVPDVPGLSTTTTCVTDVDTKYVDVNLFLATTPVYVFDSPGYFFDTSMALYTGYNNPPTACPSSFIMVGDTGDGGPLSWVLSTSNYYTVMTFHYSGSGYAGEPYAFYAYSGTLLGSLPPNTVVTTGYPYYSTVSYTTYSTYSYTTVGTGNTGVPYPPDSESGFPSYLNKGAIIAGAVVGGILLIGGLVAVVFVIVLKTRTVSPEVA